MKTQRQSDRRTKTKWGRQTDGWIKTDCQELSEERTETETEGQHTRTTARTHARARARRGDGQTESQITAGIAHRVLPPRFTGKAKESSSSSGVPSKVRKRGEDVAPASRGPSAVEAEAAAAAAAAAASAADAAAAAEAKKAEILRLLEEEPEAEPLDEVSLKKLMLSLEKKILKNQEMRIKYPDNPEK